MLSTNPCPPVWWRQMFARLRRYTALKFVGLTLFITLFFVAYFHILRSPAHATTLMPLTPLDRMIGFWPEALLPYVSLWFYVGMPPALLHGLRELIAYGCWIAGLCLAGLACFHFWPTAAPTYAIDVALHPAFAVLQGVDAAGNACPSMHVATAMFSALWLDRLLREIDAGAAARIGNGCWFALIAYSTLAIKQHVALDALAGLLLGTAFALPSLWLRPRPAADV